ncbi:CurL C-terminal domain-containing protein, partial [Streptomyces macrolidinus]|uniref:CurL C-terminal domain-containing protein n=1 Tax=Streptomyces macrolidinus TaxID=2952607 RepID=UPI0027E2BD16
MVIEEAPAEEAGTEEPCDVPSVGVVPWVVSAKSPGALDAQVDRLAESVEAEGAADLNAVAVASELANRRAQLEYRAVAVGPDTVDLLGSLKC